MRKPLFNSLTLGVLTACFGVIIGFIFAFAVERSNMPLKKFFHTITLIPLVSPPFVIALAGIMLFGHNGYLNKKLLPFLFGGFEIYGLPGLVIVETMAYFPPAYLALRGILASIDPSLEEAALDLGASKLKAFLTITLPLSAPGLASAFLLVFTLSLADFGNPLIIAGNFTVLCVQAYLAITGMYDLAGGASISVILLLPAIMAFFAQRYWLAKRSYVTITGKPTLNRLVIKSPIFNLVCFLICSFVVLITLLFYGVVFFGSFTRTWGADASFSLANYIYLIKTSLNSILDTLYLSAIATPLTGILAMIIAWLIVRKEFPGKPWLDLVSILPLAIPGTVEGIGYILAFNKPPLLLTGTATIIILCFIFRFAPAGIRSGIAELKQIDPAIEEASINLGADSITTFSKIILPLIKPAFFSSLAFCFVRCMTAVSAVIFLVSAKWELITVKMLGEIEMGNLSVGAAFAVLVILIVLVVLFALQYLIERKKLDSSA